MSESNDHFPVGPYRPEDFPEVDVAAYEQVAAELAALKSATYTGHDPDHLVAAVVDGEGLVHHVRFAGTAATRSREAIERAVVVAVAAAHERMDEAWRAVASRQFPELAAPATAPATYGGIEMAYDPREAET
jgi:hypothetical protein